MADPNSASKDDVAAEVAALSDLTYEALLDEWKRLYRAPAPKRISRSLLELGVAWKVQELALGGLSRGAKRQLRDMATSVASTGVVNEPRSITVKPGARLVREWRGTTHDVLVLDDGFEWAGRQWRSLSEIAREITGTRWSGPRFFGLEKPRANVKEAAHV